MRTLAQTVARAWAGSGLSERTAVQGARGLGVSALACRAVSRRVGGPRPPATLRCAIHGDTGTSR